MNKTRLLTILVGAIVISISAPAAFGAQTLEGDIDAEVTEFLGLVKPRINVDENQTDLTLSVEVVEGNASANESDQYYVNDTLSINVNVTSGTDRTFLVPRYAFGSAIIMRNIAEIEIFPIFGFLGLLGDGPGLFKRLFPVIATPLSNGMRVDVTSEGAKLMNISLNYWIDNETTSENLTMHLYTIGFLPGNVNGIIDGIPIIDHKVINLEVAYDFPEE